MTKQLSETQKQQVRKDLQDFHEWKSSPMMHRQEILDATQRILETLAISAGVFTAENAPEGLKNG